MKTFPSLVEIKNKKDTRKLWWSKLYRVVFWSNPSLDSYTWKMLLIISTEDSVWTGTWGCTVRFYFSIVTQKMPCFCETLISYSHQASGAPGPFFCCYSAGRQSWHHTLVMLDSVVGLLLRYQRNIAYFQKTLTSEPKASNQSIWQEAFSRTEIWVSCCVSTGDPELCKS